MIMLRAFYLTFIIFSRAIQLFIHSFSHFGNVRGVWKVVIILCKTFLIFHGMICSNSYLISHLILHIFGITFDIRKKEISNILNYCFLDTIFEKYIILKRSLTSIQDNTTFRLILQSINK